MAQSPNVVVKLSGLATEVVGGELTAVAVAPFLRHALEAFGPDRCLFGSDWPVMSLGTSYRWWLDVVDGVIADLPADGRAAVRRDTAQRVYGLASPAS